MVGNRGFTLVVTSPQTIAVESVSAATMARLLGSGDGKATSDFSRMLVIVPSQSAGRQLRERLVQSVSAQGRGGILPPMILTPAGLANFGLDQHAVADDIQAVLAWVAVLQAVRQEEVTALFPAPFVKDLAWCREFASALVDLRRTLGEGGLTFAEVADREDVPEPLRWRALAWLERRWLTLLDERGLGDRETVRQALAQTACLSERFDRVLLVATPDLTPLAVRRLETEVAAGLTIEVLVAADDAMLEEGFDRWGLPLSDYWQRQVLDTESFEERLHVRRDPARQANVVADLLGQSTLGAVAVGLVDPSLERLLSSRLADRGMAVYNPEGVTLAKQPVIVLFRTLVSFLTDPSASHAGEFLRCPDMLTAIAERWRQRQEENDAEASEARAFDDPKLLRAWDQLREDHLPGTLAELHAALKRVRASSNERERWGKTGSEINEAVWFLEEIVRSFEQRSVAEALENFLKAVYGWRAFDRDAESTQILLGILVDVRSAVATVLAFMGEAALRAADVLGMALDHVAAQQRYEASPDDPEVVPLQGWLELLWEDKPHLVLAGFNEGKVPESITSHAFLPESLRETLGLSTNAQRYARDAYLLWAIQAARRAEDGGRVDIVLGQTSSTGDPLRPSHLLLQCEDAVLAQRVAHLFAEDSGERSQASWQAAWRLAETSLPMPEDWEERLERGLSVTAINDYLACPFRFYLTHVLRMQPADPFKMELDARDFGNVIHAAMEALGRDADLVASTEAEEIAAFLHAQVQHWMEARYGAALSVPVRQQQESAKARLTQVAKVQAQARKHGWRITEVELKIHEALGDFRIAELPLRGVIDRIEMLGEETGGPWRVVDYKTTDSPVYKPDKETRNAHFRAVPRAGLPSHVREYACFDYDPDGDGGGSFYWVDLQLPLYCLAMRHARGVQPSWAHFRVSKKLDDIRIYEEAWDDALMAAALRCAEGVVADVRAGRFLPASEKVIFENYERLILGRVEETVGSGAANEHESEGEE